MGKKDTKENGEDTEGMTLKQKAEYAEGVELAERITEEIASRPDDHPIVLSEKAKAEASEEAEAEPEPEPEA